MQTMTKINALDAAARPPGDLPRRAFLAMDFDGTLISGVATFRRDPDGTTTANLHAEHITRGHADADAALAALADLIERSAAAFAIVAEAEAVRAAERKAAVETAKRDR